MKTLCDYCKHGVQETKQCYLGGMDKCQGELFQPQLQQASCSKLRELLVKRLNRLEEDHLVCDSILSCTDIQYEKQEVNNILKLISDPSPVA